MGDINEFLAVKTADLQTVKTEGDEFILITQRGRTRNASIEDVRHVANDLNDEDPTKGASNVNLKQECERAIDAEKILTNKINTENQRAEDAEYKITAKINDEIKRAISSENVINNNIVAENDRAIKSEKAITDKLNLEVDRAEGAEKIITDNLNGEINRAKSAEQTLTTNLGNEINRATNTEKLITNNLNSEISRANDAEKTIGDNLANETTRAKSAENTLSGNLTNEVNRATTAENILTNNLNSEITRAKATENTITNTINTNKPNWDDKYTKNEVDNKINQVVSNMDWKESVATYADISTTYPTPEDGWTVNVKDTDITYRYSGSAWIPISANSIPLASSSVDGKMSKQDKIAHDDMNSKKHIHGNKIIIDGITQGLIDAWNNAYIHISDMVRHITSSERTNWNDAYGKKHEHGNKSIIDALTQVIVDKWNSAYNHISDTARHITTTERSLWNTVSNKSDKVYVDQELSKKSNNHSHPYRADTWTPSWNDITSKPNTYTPSTHTHQASIITEDSGHRFTSDFEKEKWNKVDNKLDKTAIRIEGTDKNLNNYTEAGFYAIKSGIANYPCIGTDGKMIVLPWNADKWISQIVLPDASSGKPLCFRSATNGTGTVFTDWVKIYHTGFKPSANDVGLGNVDNTSDLEKPISKATQNALNGKANSNHNHDDRYYTETEINSKINTINDAINGKAANTHSHTKSQITDMPSKVSQFANDVGYITQKDVDTSQNHTHGNKSVLDKITQGLLDTWNTVSNKSEKGHKHSKSEITDFPSSLPSNGGNSDTVDGFHASQTVGTANTAVVRDANGYIQNTWFNSNRRAENMASAQYLYDTGDGYMRKKDLVNVRSEIVTDAFGLGGNAIDITGQDCNNIIKTGFYRGDQCANRCPGSHSWSYLIVIQHDTVGIWISQIGINYNNDGTYVRTKTNGSWTVWRRLDATNTSQLINDSGYITKNDIPTSLPASGGVSINMKIQDIRDTDLTPNQLTSNSVASLFDNRWGGGWRSALSVKGWSNGYAAWQLIGGSNTTTDDEWYLRSGVNDTWNSQKRIWHDGNFNPDSKISTSASCNKNWNWSGQNGQPNWLWGGNDPNNIYVYNPNNFNVSHAKTSDSAKNADTLGGKNSLEFALNNHNHDDRYYTESEINNKVNDLNNKINDKANTSHGHNAISSFGRRTAPMERNVLASGLYTYGTYNDKNIPTSYGEIISFGNGISGQTEILVSWCGIPTMHIRSLRDCDDKWSSWINMATISDIPTKLSQLSKDIHFDERYYTEAEIDNKVNAINNSINGKANSNHNHDSSYLKKGVLTWGNLKGL